MGKENIKKQAELREKKRLWKQGEVRKGSFASMSWEN